MDRREYAYKILAENNYKATEPRKILIEFLNKENNKHLSCDEIYERIQHTNPNVGIATIYRNMQLFDDLKIVKKLNFDDGVARYELANFDNSHHHHLICISCGKLVEINDQKWQDFESDLVKRLEGDYHFKIVNHDIKFYGYCSDCKDKMQGEK